MSEVKEKHLYCINAPCSYNDEFIVAENEKQAKEFYKQYTNCEVDKIREVSPSFQFDLYVEADFEVEGATITKTVKEWLDETLDSEVPSYFACSEY